MTDARRLDERTMESGGEHHGLASRGDRQPVVKLTAIMATGLAATVAAFFTSRFGIAGTVLGTAATAMIITAGSAVIGFFFEYAADKARVLPGTLRARSPRRSVLLGGLVVAAASFLVGMTAVTGVELGVGKSLSCWVWEKCPAQTAGRGTASDTTTRPSILGGGRRIADTQPDGAGQPAAPVRQRAPRQQPGPLPEPNNPNPPATPERNAPVLGTPGKEVPGQTPEGTPPDGQASPSQPSPTDEPPAEKPQSDQPVRPVHWVRQQRPG